MNNRAGNLFGWVKTQNGKCFSCKNNVVAVEDKGRQTDDDGDGRVDPCVSVVVLCGLSGNRMARHNNIMNVHENWDAGMMPDDCNRYKREDI